MTPWLFSRRLDLLAFLVPALVSLALVALGVPLGLVSGEATDTPEWTWLACIVLVDVAHVWGNLVLVYADPIERARRPALYYGLPLAALAVAVALASESELTFWSALALLAVWHFVRQQVGWVRLYRAKSGEAADRLGRPRLARFIDEGVIYAATLGPVVWWHANLPRPFAWMVQGDFVLAAPGWVGTLALGLEVAFLVAYGVKAGLDWRAGRGNPGKHLVVATTALLWWLGIVVFASDYVFAVTNVLIHGVPYAVLIVVTAQRRKASGASLPRLFRRGAWLVLGTLMVLALLEEGLWDRLVWHERDWLFPLPTVDANSLRWLLVPVLAWPQLTHYLLDAFIWRRRQNAHLV